MSAVLALAAPVAEFIATFECPDCGGGGEQVTCPPRCDGSHVFDRFTPCRTCNETGSVNHLPARDEDEPDLEAA